MNLLCRPTLPTLGTKASDIVDMDLQSTQQNTQLRIDAYKEREHLEEEGIGDQLSELQQFSWKIFEGSKLKSSPWESTYCASIQMISASQCMHGAKGRWWS